jgi:hypothetical protein
MALKFDLHIHTNFSPDAYDTVERIIKRAKRVGLDGLAITDHNTIEGAKKAVRYVKENSIDLVVIPGVEVLTSRGHLIALGVEKNIPTGLPAEEMVEICREMGCTIVVPHPFHPFRHSMGDINGLEVDAIETFNSRYITGHSNKKAMRYAQLHDIPVVAGSDAHVAEAVGYGITEIDADPNVHSVLKGIREGHTRIRGCMTPPRLHLYHAYKRFLWMNRYESDIWRYR